MNVPYFHSSWDSSNNPTKSSYFVCCLPRSGSNLLCYSLIEHGNAGIPLEYFNPTSKGTNAFLNRIFDGSSPLPQGDSAFDTAALNEFVLKLQRWRTDKNGIWGSKIFNYRFFKFFEQQEESLDAFSNQKLKFIYLSRKDKIAQSVSNYISKQSFSWSSMHENTIEMPEYSFKPIYLAYDAFCESEAQMKQYMSSKSSDSVLFVSYKDLVTNYRKTITEVYDFLEISPKNLKPPPLQRQSHRKKTEYCRLFAQDLQNFEEYKMTRQQ